jgi:hypothetical protein
VADCRLGAEAVVTALQAATRRHGTPRHLRSDNGGKFIAGALQTWLKQSGITARFIEPGRHWQNGVNESFNGRFRDECLNRELLGSVLEAQVIARGFRDEYNQIRLHSSVGYKVPASIAPNFCSKLRAPVRSAKRGLPSAGGLPTFHPSIIIRQPVQNLIAGGSEK